MIEHAFDLGITQIPVLVEGASMPDANILLETIRYLATLNALTIRPDKAEDDMLILIKRLETIIRGVDVPILHRSKMSHRLGELCQIEAPNNIHALHFSPNGKYLYAGAGKHKVEVREMPAGKHRLTLEENEREVYALAASPDGQWLASGSGRDFGFRGKFDIQMWKMPDCEHKYSIDAHRKSINSLSFSPSRTV